VTCNSLAVAVTVIPPAEAVAVTGPTVCSSGFFAHIQTGMPTRPTLSGPGFGAMPMLIATRFIRSTAICATWRGAGPDPEFGGGSGAQMVMGMSLCGWKQP